MVGRPRLRAKKAALAAGRGIPPTEAPPPAAAPAYTPPKPKPVDTEGPGIAALRAGFESNIDNFTADQFESLQTMAFEFAHEVMSMQLDPADKNFGKVLGIKQAIASSILMATTRVRSGDLKGRTRDPVAELLRRVKEEAGDDAPAEETVTAEDLFS